MAVKVTVVEPIGNLAGALFVTVGLASQVSLADATPVKLTVMVLAEAVGMIAVSIEVERFRIGCVVSRTIT